MKCPLLCVAAAVNNKRHPIEAADCLKAECAWWSNVSLACVFYSMERALWAITSEIRTIMARMPKDLAPRG